MGRPPRRRTGWRAALKGLSAVLMLTCSLDACSSSPNYPSRASAVQTGDAVISQLLRSIHFTAPVVLTRTDGTCNEADDAHGDLVTSFGYPNNVTGTEGKALLAAALTLWRQDGYSHVGAETEPDGTSQVTATDKSYSLAIYVGRTSATGIFVSSCYSTPGPTTQTVTRTTAGPGS